MENLVLDLEGSQKIACDAAPLLKGRRDTRVAPGALDSLVDHVRRDRLISTGRTIQ
jgi:hypothetical protein